MTTVLVGLGEFAVSGQPGDVIRTLGLGSCVAIVAIHAKTGAVGMAHVVLPESTGNAERAQKLPGYFADTAVPALVQAMEKSAGPGRLIVKLAGGAAVLRNATASEDVLNIGKRNVLAVKKALWKRGLGALAEDVGGDQSRSVSVGFGSIDVEVKQGNVLVRKL